MPIPIKEYGSATATRAVARLAKRLSALERLDTAAFRTRALKVFHKPLSPQQIVEKILHDVRRDGDAALLSYAQRLDGVSLTPKTLWVTAGERRTAFRHTAPALREALELAAERIADYQQRLMPKDVPAAAHTSLPSSVSGVKTGLNWTAIQRAGLYVPGGTAAYPSSVLMNAVPAQVAGVKELVLATPCDKTGAVSDGVLCACEILGIREIYRIGGAQAIAALAYGTKTIRPVDKIVGPGNLFVMLAKRAVFGQVDIDMLAGPSEVLVIADGTADPVFIAADLLAQAEHDPLAACILLTPDRRLAARVKEEVRIQLRDLPRRSIATTALKDWGLICVTRSLNEAVQLANTLAPEHLEVMTRNARSVARQLTTAGAIFIGPYATESLGDYVAGPSHTLPTGATARAFSGLSVYSFLRRTSIIEADRAGLSALAEATTVLAAAEGLEAHRRAVVRRLR